MNFTKTDSQKQDNLNSLYQQAIRVCKHLERHYEAKENPIQANFNPPEQLPEPPALAHLCTVFNLSPFERYILLLCVAMELEPSLGSLYAEVNKNPGLPYPTPYLAYNTFPSPTWSAFDPDSPLIEWQLIELKTEQVFTQSSIKLNLAILFYLLCSSYTDPQLKDIIKPVKRDNRQLFLPLSHQRIVSQIVEIWSRSTEFLTENSIIQLCGDDRGAKTAIAAQAASVASRTLNQISLSWLVTTLNLPTSELNVKTLIKLYTRLTLLTDNFLLINCDDINLTDSAEIKLLNQLLEHSLHPIIILSVTPINTAKRSTVTFDIPKLTPDEQATIWHIHLGETAAQLGEYIETLTHQFNLPTTAIESACLHSKASMGSSIKTDADFDLKTALWDNCRIYARPRLDSLATRIETRMNWDDLVLPFEKKQALQEIVWHVKQKYTVYGDCRVSFPRYRTKIGNVAESFSQKSTNRRIGFQEVGAISSNGGEYSQYCPQWGIFSFRSG